jgi:hypothetical protein
MPTTTASKRKTRFLKGLMITLAFAIVVALLSYIAVKK